MRLYGRRPFIIGSLGVAGTALVAACSNDSGGGQAGGTTTSAPRDPATVLAAAGAPGLADETAWQARIDEYLAGAAANPDPSSLAAIVAALIAAHRDPAYRWDPTTVTVESLSDRWEQIDTWQDTRDFTLLYMQWVLALADGSSPMTTLDPAVTEAMNRRMLDNRYRYDDPLPEGRTDQQWFWSENHIIILLVNEYLAGQRNPTATFTITGLTGAEHMARSKPLILAWVAERARFGFFEWHSHVYMKKNVEPLATLVEWSNDAELVLAAAMALDLCVLDMAGHCHANTYTASRGRTYAKDKLSDREGTFDTFKLLFDDTELPFRGGADNSTNHLAGATRYRPPQTLIDIAVATAPGVTRERHGIFVDGTEPITDNPEAPFGYDFSNPDNLEFWWSQGAVGIWQLTDVSLSEAAKFRLLETAELAPVKALVALNGNDPARVKQWVHKNHAAVNFGQLREANTYIWRGDEVALATVLDHRFGDMRDQIHVWQATIDPGAFVFTTHPVTDVPKGDSWTKDKKPGYWTGEGSIPRSAQHERTGVHIYQPGWDQTNIDPALWALYGYQPLTHAYVPQDRFDDVVRDGRWTFARKGDGYIALWSWREPDWRVYDPAVNPTDGMTKPFDLVAAGGPDNVWIVEVGDPSVAQSFEAFMAGCKASEPAVTRDDAGFTVAWTSPTSGAVTFGSKGDFTVAGKKVDLADHPRHESRWGTVPAHTERFELRGEQTTLTLDFTSRSRSVGPS